MVQEKKKIVFGFSFQGSEDQLGSFSFGVQNLV